MWEILRKFGLEYSDLPTTIENFDLMLRMLILRVDPRNQKRTPLMAYIFTAFTAMSYVYVYNISMAWFVFVHTPETGGDIICAIIAFSLGLSSMMGVVKLMFMYFNHKEIQDIVAGYLACDALVEQGSRFARNLSVTQRIVKKRALIFWTVLMFDGTVYVLKTLMMPGRHIMEDCFTFYGLEPMFESPNYEIAFIINLGGIIMTIYLPIHIVGFVIILVGYTEAQLLALGKELTNIWTDAQESIGFTETEEYNADKEKLLNEFVKKQLGNIVKIHTINIQLINQIESVFRGAIAVELILFILGLIAELLGGLENTYMELPFALMLVGVDCLMGQKVADACTTFENSIYDCAWENFNVSNRKIVLIMLTNAQKPLELSAGGVTILNYATFMSLVKSTYSAYTTLHSTMN